MSHKSFIFKLNYGERLKEKIFIKDILRRYDINTLIGAGVYVNNNPYNLEMLLYLNFEKDSDDFEKWLSINYKDKKRIYNYFIDDIIESFFSNGYNVGTFIGEDSVDNIITAEPNRIFLFPDKELMNSQWRSGSNDNNFLIFLSHSSKDKKIVDKIFNEVQKSNIKAWYDKYEIQPGDSITDKINEGLEDSNLGIICISNNFFNASSGWTSSELNYFIQKRMRLKKANFICLNFDVPHDKLPPLLQDYKYIDMQQKDAIEILISVINEKMKEIK